MRYSRLDLVEEQNRLQASLEEYVARHHPRVAPLPRGVREVLERIHRDLLAPELTVSVVKRSCGIRSNNISSRFRHVLGVGIRDYIELRRMEAAGHFLATTEVSVFELAMALGYAHETTFYRAFQRYFEKTPGEYRSTMASPAPGPCSQNSASKSTRRGRGREDLRGKREGLGGK